MASLRISFPRFSTSRSSTGSRSSWLWKRLQPVYRGALPFSKERLSVVLQVADSCPVTLPVGLEYGGMDLEEEMEVQ